MRRAHVYRNLGRPQVWFGVEPLDLLGLGLLLWLLMLLAVPTLPLVLSLALSYLLLRLGKRGKPPGYTRQLARYVARPAYFAAGARDRAGKPFPVPTSHPIHPSPQGEPE